MQPVAAGGRSTISLREIPNLSSSPDRSVQFSFRPSHNDDMSAIPSAPVWDGYMESQPLLADHEDQQQQIQIQENTRSARRKGTSRRLSDLFQGYELELAKVIMGSNGPASFFTGILVMGVMLSIQFVFHNVERTIHYTWIPAPHTATVVLAISLLPLLVTLFRCCSYNTPRFAARWPERVGMLALSTGLQILMLFLIWFSLYVQASTVNYNILVITFSIPPILTFVIFLFWPFERGDVLSGVLALLLSATTFCLCTELWQGISLDTSKDWRLLLVGIAFAVALSGWLVSFRRCMLINGFRLTLLVHTFFLLIGTLTISLTMFPLKDWQLLLDGFKDFSTLWPLLCVFLILIIFHFAVAASCYYSDGLTFAALVQLGLIFGNGKMYLAVRYGIHDWSPETIAGIVLLILSLLLTQVRIWTVSRRLPTRFIQCFPPSQYHPSKQNV